MRNKYVFSSGTVAEASSLQYQHRLFLHEMGMLIPERFPLDEIETVLDTKSGPGGWAIDLAKAYPAMQVTGMDVDIDMVRMATEDARMAKVANVTFDVGDICQVLPYTSAYFDFVRVLMGSELASPQMWPGIIRELLRVIRPGGWLNLIEYEPGPMSSPALDVIGPLLSKAVVKAEWAVSPDGMAATSGVLLPRLLTEAGCTGVGYTLYPVNLGGWDNLAGRTYVMTALAYGNRVTPFLLKAEMITQPDMNTLLQKIEQDVEQLDFCGVGMLISTFARKPTTQEAHTGEE